LGLVEDFRAWLDAQRAAIRKEQLRVEIRRMFAGQPHRCGELLEQGDHTQPSSQKDTARATNPGR
jgi:hypothetical protein